VKQVEQLALVVLEGGTGHEDLKRDLHSFESHIEIVLVVLQSLTFIDNQTLPRYTAEKSAAILISSGVVTRDHDVASKDAAVLRIELVSVG
jgi:hypothetical protein